MPQSTTIGPSACAEDQEAQDRHAASARGRSTGSRTRPARWAPRPRRAAADGCGAPSSASRFQLYRTMCCPQLVRMPIWAKLQQQRAEAVDLVVDAVLAQRPPVDAGVDREHRLVEPELGDAGEPRHREIGADLDDGVDVRPVHLDDGVAQFALGDMRDQHRALRTSGPSAARSRSRNPRRSAAPGRRRPACRA